MMSERCDPAMRVQPQIGAPAADPGLDGGANIMVNLIAMGLLALMLASCDVGQQGDVSGISKGVGYGVARGSVHPGDIHVLNGDISR